MSLQTQELLASQQWPAGMFPEDDDRLETFAGSLGTSQSFQLERRERDSPTAASSAKELFKFKRGSALSRSGVLGLQLGVLGLQLGVLGLQLGVQLSVAD